MTTAAVKKSEIPPSNEAGCSKTELTQRTTHQQGNHQASFRAESATAVMKLGGHKHQRETGRETHARREVREASSGVYESECIYMLP